MQASAEKETQESFMRCRKSMRKARADIDCWRSGRVARSMGIRGAVSTFVAGGTKTLGGSTEELGDHPPYHVDQNHAPPWPSRIPESAIPGIYGYSWIIPTQDTETYLWSLD